MTDHTLIRAVLVSGIATILATHWGVTHEEALRRFYSSKTALAFADDSTGLYGQSALNIAGKCVLEIDGHGLSSASAVFSKYVVVSKKEITTRCDAE